MNIDHPYDAKAVKSILNEVYLQQSETRRNLKKALRRGFDGAHVTDDVLVLEKQGRDYRKNDECYWEIFWMVN